MNWREKTSNIDVKDISKSIKQINGTNTNILHEVQTQSVTLDE